MSPEREGIALQLPLPVGLKEEADFAEYLPGPNAEAVAAIAGWANGRGSAYLYLCGPTGTGKTHLLQAACRAASDLPASVIYLPLTDGRLAPAALDDLEHADMIALDDVHAVVGDPRWEHALFGLYNRLREAGRRLLVSADVPAGKLQTDLPDLRSRLAWGPGYRLQSLGESDCERLLVQTAKRRGLRLGADAVSYIMRRCPREPSRLLAILDDIDRTALSGKRRPTLSLVRTLLQTPNSQ